MQDLEKNMEELFLGASEAYPLKQGKDRWDEISTRLSGQTMRKDHHYRRIILLLLLFFILSTSAFIMIFNSGNKTKYLANQQQVPVQKENANKEVVPGNINKQEIILKHEKQSETLNPVNVRKRILRDFSTFEIAFNNNDNATNLLTGIDYNSTKNSSTNDLTGHLFQNNNYEIIPLKKPYPYFNTYLGYQGKTLVENNSKPAPGQTFTRRGWYYGLLTGPGFNSVNSGKMNKAGFEIGLVAGYHLNRRMSLETGLFYTKNFYEAKAEYFNIKAIEPMLSGGRELKEVHGSQKVLELPLNFRYFTSEKKKVFLLGGLSSYLVTEESNWYLTSLNGNNEMLYGEYKKKRPYFAAVITAAAGYEKTIGGKNMLRFQPYFQVPVQGIGVGNLRLISTGIHVGLTRHFD